MNRVISFVFVFVIAAALSVEAWRRIPFRGDVLFPESGGTAPAFLASRGEPLYQDIDHGSFIILCHSPLFYWLTSRIARVMRLDMDGTASVGRSLAFMFTILSAFIAVFLRRMELENNSIRFNSLFAFGLALSNPLFMRWGLMVRPDTAAMFFSFLGAWLCLLSLEQKAHQFIFIVFGLFCFGLALGCKQTAFSASLAFLTLCVYRRHFRLATAFFGAFVIMILCGLFFVHFAFGPYALRNILATASAPIALDNILRPLKFTLRDTFPMLLILVGWVIYQRKHFSTYHITFTSIYFMISFLMALVASIKAGSSTNYFIECIMLAGILSERLISRLWTYKSLLPRIAALMLLLFIAGNVWARPFVWRIYRDEFQHSRSAVELIDHLNGRYKNGLVISSDAYVSMTAGKRPLLVDSFIFSAMRQTGHWDPSSLHEMIREKRIAAFIFDFMPGKETGMIAQHVRMWPEDTIQIILSNYELIETYNSQWRIYQPKAASSPIPTGSSSSTS